MRVFLTPKSVLIPLFKTVLVKYQHSAHINSFGFGPVLAGFAS